MHATQEGQQEDMAAWGGRGVDLDHASLANTRLVPQASGYVCSTTCSPSVIPGPIAESAGRETPLLVNETLSLAAWHVSSSLCSRRAFLQTLPGSSWQHGGQAQGQFITPPGKNGIAGVTAGKLIHSAPLWQI